MPARKDHSTEDLAARFGICPGSQAILVGFNFASVKTALRATVPGIALKVIIGARCIDPYDGIGRAMSLRCFLGFKGLHPLSERCATNHQNHQQRDQAVSDLPPHLFPPISPALTFRDIGDKGVSCSAAKIYQKFVEGFCPPRKCNPSCPPLRPAGGSPSDPPPPAPGDHASLRRCC